MKSKSILAITIIFTTLLMGSAGYGQDFYAGYSFDVKMAKAGPTAPSYDHLGGTHNFEIRAGMEFDTNDDGNGMRYGLALELHNKISYWKGVGHVDYILKDWPFKGLHNYAGFQVGLIGRNNIPRKVNGGVGASGIQFYYSPEAITFGPQFEIQFEISDWLTVSANYDIFWGEGPIQQEAVVWTDRWRTDFMFGILLKSKE